MKSEGRVFSNPAFGIGIFCQGSELMRGVLVFFFLRRSLLDDECLADPDILLIVAIDDN